MTGIVIILNNELQEYYNTRHCPSCIDPEYLIEMVNLDLLFWRFIQAHFPFYFRKPIVQWKITFRCISWLQDMDTGGSISEPEVLVIFNCQVPGSPEFKDILKRVPISTLKKSGAQVFIILLHMFAKYRCDISFCNNEYGKLTYCRFTYIFCCISWKVIFSEGKFEGLSV